MKIKKHHKKIVKTSTVKSKKSRKETLINPGYNRFVKDFPLLKNKKIVYLDSGATTQKPKVVIDKLKNFYEWHNANSHRGMYNLSGEATHMLHDARNVFAEFINASPEEIIFTRNSTEALNGIANSLGRTLMFDNKHNVVTTIMEHHSNFVPWQQLCKRTGAEFRVVDYDIERNILDTINSYIDENTLVFSITGMSNVTGMIPDLKNIISNIRAKNKDTIIVVDATQLIAHRHVNVEDLDVDFLVFSAHKLYGPTGVGIMYGKRALLEKLQPFNYGGGMINKVDVHDSDWAEVPEKFEAGTIDTPGIVAAAEAINYLESNFDEILRNEDRLKNYALQKLRQIPELNIIGHTKEGNYGPVISFTVDGVHPHDLATICNEHDVCIRAGHHCCQPLMKKLGLMATSRISIGMYNTKEDIDKLVKAIEHAIKLIR